MGISTEGIIAYGIICEEGYEFPWVLDEECDGDIDEWWRKVNGFTPLYNLYDEEGNYAKGFYDGDPRVKEHFLHMREWEVNNPMPVQMENYCSGGCSYFALIVPGSVIKCYRGHATRFDPSGLTVSEEGKQDLEDFVEQWGIEFESGPGWFLMCYTD